MRGIDAFKLIPDDFDVDIIFMKQTGLPCVGLLRILGHHLGVSRDQCV